MAKMRGVNAFIAVIVDAEVVAHTAREEKCVLGEAGDVFAEFLDAEVGGGEVADKDVAGGDVEEVEEGGD